MIHILGIAGTFMAGIATLAQQSGVKVSGSDAHIYPPMSTLLDDLGIDITEGYEDISELEDKTVIIGNALSRGNLGVEHTLSNKLSYTSGPQWLHENILKDKTVLAVAGTHGKTTTASILAWILHATGKQAGFLIGGKPGNFEHSARLGQDDLFVVEADEYDTAFFDKRSKFVHYHPHIAILNNLEFDHADIFKDIDAIKTQFHHLIRTLPQNGQLIVNNDDANLSDVLNMGVWTPVEHFSVYDESADWFAQKTDASVNQFKLKHRNKTYDVKWPGLGTHNMSNALAAVAAAYHAGVPVAQACAALSAFCFPAKRLQRHPTHLGFTLFEDFAHHPTAIHKTLNSLRDAFPEKRLIALLELRSNTMKTGVHQQTLAPSLIEADIAHVVLGATTKHLFDDPDNIINWHQNVEACLHAVKMQIKADDLVVVMSNGHFKGIIEQLRRI